jgi:serine/threonine protein phosphatase PrpC
MGLLTIGAFAKASRLSPKALRLYDELGLLRPAHVDPESGYRFYDPAQLERARLVAWLRRLGMPLARIRAVCDLEPAAAADEVAGYWAQVVADTATRQQLASFLVDYLSGKGTAMSDAHTTLGIRYAARSDTGKIRTSNEDAAYAGARLLAVADGVRGPGGDRASAAAIDALKPLEANIPAGDLLNALQEAVHHADQALHGIAESDPGADGVVTTLTAMVWSGSQLALVHIGDSRAYLLRGGELFQITHDHSYVQSLVDEGRLSADEAASHPQRAMLLRALDGKGSPKVDLSLHDAQVGDRYLLCSDGLSAVVDPDSLRAALTTTGDPEQVVARLIDLAYRGGAPDNIACVVADVVQL